MGKPSNTGIKGISRFDQQSQTGYQVRVWDPFLKKVIVRFFSDEKFPGVALAKAIEYRNIYEKQIGKPRSERQIRVIKRERKPLLTVSPDGYPAYRVNYTISGVTRAHYVHIGRRGQEEAYRVACKLLEEKMAMAETAAAARDKELESRLPIPPKPKAKKSAAAAP